MSTHDPTVLPPGLPVPTDDGATRHLPGMPVPAVALSTTAGADMLIGDVGPYLRRVVYAYPRTGRPGEAPLVEDWDLIPGARGCTPESCGFRDHHAELARAGADVVGLSTLDIDDQREAATRLHLPFPLVSDAGLRLTRAMDLPTMDVGGQVLLKRFTLVIREGRVEHVFYPVFPPDRHAEQVLRWLGAQLIEDRRSPFVEPDRRA
ncbi:MAG TPA: peroxiredoxin [Actinomycetes bacterium]|nr:peroxiredoxin [Actinomycetes bacterium]